MFFLYSVDIETYHSETQDGAREPWRNNDCCLRDICHCVRGSITDGEGMEELSCEETISTDINKIFMYIKNVLQGNMPGICYKVVYILVLTSIKINWIIFNGTPDGLSLTLLCHTTVVENHYSKLTLTVSV